MKTVIGLVGHKQAGKSTTVSILKEFFPELREVSFANKMKNVCSKVFDIPRHFFEDGMVKELPLEQFVTLDEENLALILKDFDVADSELDKFSRDHIGKTLHTPRKIAQYVGTEVLRAVHPDIHIIHAFKDLPHSGIFVVSDIRFPNELEYPKNAPDIDFYPLYIDNHKAAAIAELDAHVSEKHIKNLRKDCMVVDNNGTLADLRKQLSIIGNSLKASPKHGN